jgi:imipenem/basic amino acid-specific outer membrane pore
LTIKYLLVLLGLFSTTCIAQNFDEIFTKGKVSGNLRAFYFDGEREGIYDRKSLTVGGILSYQTASFYNFKMNASFFSSNGITGLTHMPESGLSTNLNPDGRSINVLGEVAFSYADESNSITYGRQRLSTPLVNDFYDRMLPNSFEALSGEHHFNALLSIKGAYITGWKYKGTDQFVSPTANYGFDRNIGMISVISKQWGMKNEIYDYYIPDVMNVLYVQSEYPKVLPENSLFNLACSMQYLKERGVGNDLIGLDSTYLIGTKIGFIYEDWNLFGIYSHVGDQTIMGSGGNGAKMAWGGFIAYTGLQIDGGEENAGATAYGMTVAHRFDSFFDATLKCLHVDQSDQVQSHPNSLTQNPRPDSDEYNFDMTYQPYKEFRLRTRFAHINYDSGSTKMYQINTHDENNIRIIVDYLF